jgi:hypothetical protein
MSYSIHPDQNGPVTFGDVGVVGEPSGVTIGYDAKAGSYTVSDGTNSATFSGSPSGNAGMDIYTSNSGSVTDELDVLNNIRSGADHADEPLELSYLSFGKWTRVADVDDHRITYFLFGYPTDTSTIPRTGTANYTTSVSGTEVGCATCAAGVPFGGAATFTADFGTGTVNTSLDLNDASGAIGSFQGNGLISGNQFSGGFNGSFAQAGTGLKDGKFTGGFFGPSAAEMGYTFTLHRYLLDPYAGASLPPNPDDWFLGVVVGKEQPTPPAAPAATSFPLQTSSGFQTVSAERIYWNNGSLGVADYPGLTSSQTISYDAVTGAYTVNFAADSSTATATFDAASRTTDGSIDTYTRSSASAQDQLELYDNVRVGTSDASAPIKLTYLSFGIWSHKDLTNGEDREHYFLFGYPTATEEIPQTGTASYSTVLASANMKTELNEPAHMLSGSATFTALFAQGKVSTDLTLNYPDATSYTYSGSGPINGNTFTGAFTTSNDPFYSAVGGYAGGFFGPQAQEVGYVFVLERGQRGGAGGVPLTDIVGAVVGRKQ